MGLVFSKANSIHFINVDGGLSNNENTLSLDERYASFSIRSYCQKWDDASVVTSQCVSEDNTLPVVEVYAPGLIDTLTPSIKSSYPASGSLSARYFFEFDVDFSSYAGLKIQIKVTQDGIVWKSEWQENYDLTDDLAEGYLLKAEYTNKDNPSALPNFQIDYTTGIDFYFYAEMIIRESGYEIEDEVYTNIDEKKLIGSQLFKTRTLKTDNLPEFMIDLITLAGKHFVFMVNELRYLTNSAPDVSQKGTNLRSMEWSIVHRELLGLSTDDKGINTTDMDDFIMIKSSDSITGSWSFTLPAGYLFHYAYCGHGVGSAGAYTPKMGTSPGGAELWTSGITNIALATQALIAVHDQEDFALASDSTIYFTLTGAGAVGKIYCQLIKNFE